MATTKELLEGFDVARVRREGAPVNGPTNNRTLLQYATRQSPTHAVVPEPCSECGHQPAQGASINLDRELTRGRDHLAPVAPMPLGSFSAVLNTSYPLDLPREARQVVIQNNSDLAGSAATIYVNWHGGPAAKGQFAVRQGQTATYDVFGKTFSILVTATININVTGSEGGAWIGYGI